MASDQTISRNPRAWRFAAALLDDAEHVIFRDTDSRISRRESDAVMQWLDSGKTLHIMRDHPHHGHAIMAGMWGIKVGEKPKRLIARVLQEATGEEKPEDQQLLETFVYPNFVNDCLAHDSFFRRESSSVRFPNPRQSPAFVGEIIDSHGEPKTHHRELLQSYEKSFFRRARLAILDRIRSRLSKVTKRRLLFLMDTR